MRRVFVTGGTGFIGSNLAEALIKLGVHTRILRRHNSDLSTIKGIPVEHRIGDVRDVDSLRQAIRGCDTVFHTAAMVAFKRERRQEQYETNVLGTQNVVRACLDAGVEKLIHTSSVAALGYTTDDTLITEETPYNWGQTSNYKYTKHLAEQEVLDAAKTGLYGVIVNPSVVVGERDIHMHGGQLIRDIKRGFVPFYIEGGMSIVYVGDVVRGHIAAALHGRTGERYILSGENLSHKEVFRRASALIGGRAPFAKIPLLMLRVAAHLVEGLSKLLKFDPIITPELVAGAGKKNWYSCEKAERELGYSVTSFDTAILAAYRWYTENGYIK
jgi:dihydroflavonol-4-reductase